jgi:RNA polymerase sigma-70 factor (ECF subfamily)
MDPMGGAHPDEELVRRFNAGDETAFDEMVLRYRKEIYRIAYRITRDHAEADDLAQETFCRAYRALGQFRGDSSLKTWLCRIVSNLSLNVVQSARVARREATTVEDLALSGAAPMIQAPAAEAVLERKERGERLRMAIKDLPGKQRYTLILRAFEGLQYKEIARVMGCSVGTAKANFFHAVSSLKRELEGSL